MKKIILILILSIGISSNAFATGNDSNALLLTHLDVDFTDASVGDGNSPHTPTLVSLPTINGAAPKFGAGDALFVSASTSYTTYPDSTDWAFGTGNFTVDFWYKPVTTGNQDLCGQGSDGNNVWRCQYDGTNLCFRVASGGVNFVNIAVSQSISAGTWYHIACIRGWSGNANTWALCFNGTALGTTSDSTSFPDYTGTFQIGNSTNSADGSTNGHIDEFRVSNTARWTANFTPPTSAYSSGSGVKQLATLGAG